MDPRTELVHGGRVASDPFRATAPPLYQTATFAQESSLAFGAFDYTRSGNPTRAALEEQLAALEGAARACAFSSGMAALTAVCRLVSPGERIVAAEDLYGGTWRLLERLEQRHGVRVERVDPCDLEATAAALDGGARLLLVETPSNPLLRVSDLRALARLARERDVRLAVDATMMTPLLCQPLALGADLVVHSATKFLGGHGDVTAGVVAARDPELAEEIAFTQNAEGAALAPFECWLLLRGLETLALRLEQQQASATTLAARLASREDLRAVHFPSLPTHPGHALHARQAGGPGAVLSFETGSVLRSQQIVEGLALFPCAVSFGGVRSQASLPCRMSHASLPGDETHLPADLVRLAVGIEHVDDLLADVEQALDGSRGADAVAAERRARLRA